MYSITLHGLRMPIELFGLTGDDPAKPAYGLISGHRRLAAFRHLRDLRKNGDFATIPALLRNPADIAEIYTAMVEENEIRRDLSPWERAAIAVTARDTGVPWAECFIWSGWNTVRSTSVKMSVPLMSSATREASRIAMLEY